MILKVDGGKKAFDSKKFLRLGAALILTIVSSLLLFSSDEDTSVMATSNRPLSNGLTSSELSQSTGDQTVEGLIRNSTQMESESNNAGKTPQVSSIKVIYSAKQVISSNQAPSAEDFVPIGTNMIGKLLTAIDTRENAGFYKVLLPYGAKHQNGSSIPKNAVLFGSVSYPGNGDKVFLAFNRGVLPEGQEFPIQAHALSSSDYSPGIVGDFHGKTGTRLVATLGLTMVSGMAEVMTDKHALGQNGQETVGAKSTAKNAFYNGLSKASEFEASRQLEELNNQPEYVTVEAGKDIIVSLTASANVQTIETESNNDE